MSDSVGPHRRKPTSLPRPWDSPGKSTGVGCHFLLQCVKVKSEREVAQSCPTLSDPMDCSLPGSSVHGISQARVLEWGAIYVAANDIVSSYCVYIYIYHIIYNVFIYNCIQLDNSYTVVYNVQCICIPLCIYIPHLVYPFIYWWTFSFFPCLGCCE